MSRLDPVDAEDAMRLALLYVFQPKKMTPMTATAVIRALAQDGYIVALAATPAPLDVPVIAAMRPARRGGYRRLTFDNGRYETYDCVFIQHPGGEWDRILIARDDGTIATALAALINATPAPLDVERLARAIDDHGDICSRMAIPECAAAIAAAYAEEPK